MKVDRVVVRMIRVPIRMTRKHGVGDISSSVTNVILEIGTDSGLTGWGEASPWTVFTGTAEASAAAIDVYFRPLLLGADPFAVNDLMQRCDRTVFGHGDAKAAVEMALLDLVGQALGAPIHRMLGGAVRMEIPLSVSIADPDFAADLDLAKRVHAEGIRLFKVKTGFTSHATDLKRLEALRQAFGDDMDLRVDYNQGLEAWDAIRQLKDVEAFRPTFIEQPVPRDRLDAMAAITAAIDTPILADESVFTPAEAIRLVRERAADGVSIKIMKSGGILPARRIAEIAEAGGLAAYGGTMFEGGIALSAGMHLVAATRNISLGAEFYTATYVLECDVLATPVQQVNGKTQVPSGPGLGITVDRNVLKHHTAEQRG